MRRSPALALLLLAAAVPAPAHAADSVFTRVKAATVKTDADAPRRFAAFAVDRRALRDAARPGRVLALPAPDGRLQRFALREAPVMEPGLARRHPEIRTYAGRGLTDRTATVRLSVTPLGLHASVRGAGRQWYVEPPRAGAADRVVSFVRSALPATAEPPRLQDPLHDHDHEARAAEDEAAAAGGEPVVLRTYRLALVSDPNYSRTSGAAEGLDPSSPGFLERLRDRTTAAKAVLMTRVNQLYETDFGARMLLVDDTDRLNLVSQAEATGPNGPCGPTACFTTAQLASCSGGLLTRNQAVTGLIAGARDFDIGHIALGGGGGGIAGLGVVGQVRKAAGCTGLEKPIGDVFAVDYVAHEMGHQHGGNHTFNGTNGSCLATNRNVTGAAAVEPGSGTTVQAYAGICASDNLQSNSDPVFSQFSIEEMGRYMRSAPGTLSSTQLVVLRERSPFTLAYGKRTTPVLPAAATAAEVDAAVEALLPEGGTVTTTATADGFQVVFGGALTGEPVELLAVGGTDGFVGETVSGGPTTQGGRADETRNTAPAVTTAPAFTIPKQTPFTLTAQGTDADGDALTYLWEQDDAAPPALGAGLVDPIKVTGPLFRVFGTAARYASPEDAFLSPSPGQNVPGADPSRAFPDTRQVALDNTNARTGLCPAATPDPVGALPAATPEQVDCFSEFLPTATWAGLDATSTMHFRVTARDNHPGAGGTGFADTAVTVDKATGPFRVLPALPGDSGLTARWLGAGTELTTPQVRISLSTDGGRTFPLVLAEATPNDGSQVLTVPEGVKTTEGRLKVEAVGNVFYDVSHTDLTIG